MADSFLSRRQFIQTSAVVGAAVAGNLGPTLARAAEAAKEIEKTPSYNPKMEYRRLGKTGAWVSAVCMGGHWKRINQMVQVDVNISGEESRLEAAAQQRFDQNRADVIGRCMEHGINLVDACTGPEVLAYSRALKGRRDKMLLSFSWAEKELRQEDYRTAPRLLEGMEQGMKAAGLDYVDLWRVTCHEKGGRHTPGEVEELVKALEQARKQGKCRFTGISSHDRPWLKMMVETYPQQIQVILSPYTADSSELPEDSLFEAVRKHEVGFLGIKPFASNSLFRGDGSPTSPHAQEDDKRARLAIRYILANPAITAPIPGLISVQQVDNVVAAIGERRELDKKERAELRQAGQEMWARLPDDYQWLKEWRQV